jgi:hypothetical protein
MSRLYTWLNTDKIKSTHTACGNQETDITVHYGSSGDSKPLLDVHIFWEKGAVKPIVTITNHLKE